MRYIKLNEKWIYILFSSYPIIYPLFLGLFYLNVTFILGRFPEVMLDDPKHFNIHHFYMPIIDGSLIGFIIYLPIWIPTTIYLLIFERIVFKKALIISILLQILGFTFLYTVTGEILTWYLD